MKDKLHIAMLTLPLILQGCATATKSSLLAAAIGGTVGAMIGRQHSDSPDGPYAGAAIGASIGALIGYQAHREKEKGSKSNSVMRDIKDDFPELTKPKLRSVWVPDKIEGNRYIKGHTIYIIEESEAWKNSNE